MKELYKVLEVELIYLVPQDAIAKSNDYDLPAIPYGLDDNFGTY